MSASPMAPLSPYDEYNQELEANLHPPDWSNPTPDGKYNLVVIGAGTAGLVAAAGAAGMGAKVALVERELLGGDCLNVGCVPSKALIASAHAAAAVREAGAFGVQIPAGTEVHFGSVMERMRKLRAGISPHDSVQRFSDLGVDVFLGEGRFTSPGSIEVKGATLDFSKAVIATGARAAAPPIEGLESVDYLTNETVFSLTELPQRLGIVGGGPVGCEMAQAFARLGSEVTLFLDENGILPREAPDAGTIVGKHLVHDGVKMEDYGKSLSLSRSDRGTILCRNRSSDEAAAIEIDQLLIAAGRAPNVGGLGLEKAGIAYDERRGITVNQRLQTTNRNVFAAGDVCSKFQFTHAADFMARTVIRNALFLGRSKVSKLVIPWTTYTSPEVAHVGPLWKELDRDKEKYDSFSIDMGKVDRAVLEGGTDGFVRIHVAKGTDKIVAATIVANNAGDLISQVSQAMTNGIGLSGLANAISPYPTQGEAIRKVGDAYNRTKLTPMVARIFKKWLEWAR